MEKAPFMPVKMMSHSDSFQSSIITKPAIHDRFMPVAVCFGLLRLLNHAEMVFSVISAESATLRVEAAIVVLAPLIPAAIVAVVVF